MVCTEEERKEVKGDLGKAKVAIDAYMGCLKTITCGFCSGWGHSTKKCSVFLEIEKMANKSAVTKIAWGKIKAQYVTENLEDNIEMALVGKKRQRTVDTLDTMLQGFGV